MEKAPKIRQIEALPVDTPQGRVVVLRDPFGFSPAMLQVSQNAFYVISLFDGKRDLRDIQAIYMRQFGDLLFTEHLEELIGQLDSCHFLDNERYTKLKEDTIRQFRESPLRPATHAGTGYPATEKEARTALGQMFTAEGGAGEVDREEPGNTVRAVVAPHIDFERGGACYSFAYRELAKNSRAVTYVVLGTAHCDTGRPFALTLKDFQTPLGLLENDREFGQELLEGCPWLLEDEFSHRSEHSVEFQAVMLQYLFAGRREVKIVPLLCGSFAKEALQQVSPAANTQVKEFLSAFGAALSKRGDDVCLIASADLSHVGLRFGDQVVMNDRLLAYIQEHDLTTLEYVKNADAEGFYNSVVSDGNKRKICGLPCIYTMLSAIPEGKGRLLRYMQAPDKAAGSVVTFASLVIE